MCWVVVVTAPALLVTRTTMTVAEMSRRLIHRARSRVQRGARLPFDRARLTVVRLAQDGEHVVEEPGIDVAPTFAAR